MQSDNQLVTVDLESAVLNMRAGLVLANSQQMLQLLRVAITALGYKADHNLSTCPRWAIRNAENAVMKALSPLLYGDLPITKTQPKAAEDVHKANPRQGQGNPTNAPQRGSIDPTANPLNPFCLNVREYR
jgi:hypothetical protein